MKTKALDETKKMLTHMNLLSCRIGNSATLSETHTSFLKSLLLENVKVLIKSLSHFLFNIIPFLL